MTQTNNTLFRITAAGFDQERFTTLVHLSYGLTLAFGAATVAAPQMAVATGAGIVGSVIASKIFSHAAHSAGHNNYTPSARSMERARAAFASGPSSNFPM